MLTETFVAATEAVNKPSANLSSSLKDIGIFHYEFQPQNIFRYGYKKSSVGPNCLAISKSHIFAAQAGKAVINVYSLEKGNQEATVPFPDKIHSLVYADNAAILVIGTDDGKLILWEVTTGRINASAPSHLEAVTCLAITKNNEYIISGSPDAKVHVWPLDQLVSFSSSTASYNSSRTKDVPSQTFSAHRTGITAVGVGQSTSHTNFAVSAATDRTCYLWHIETCQILRTFLAISTLRSITLDPADRAIYFGNDDGKIQSVDLFDTSSGQSKRSIYDRTDSTPIQLTSESNWIAQSSEVGAAQSLTLSYDGMTLLSGHKGGAIIRWDVAKHRIVSEIANLNQPVSYIKMLIPDGLKHQPSPYVIPAVVKPRLDLNAESTETNLGIPASYSVLLQVTQAHLPLDDTKDIAAALTGSLFSDIMLDAAIQAMNARSAGISDNISVSNNTNNNTDTYKIQGLEEEKLILEKQLAAIRKLHYDAQERHLKRMEQRETIGQQRREAYFAAKKKGKDGDGAMKPYDKKLEAIDVESDEEESRGSNVMDVDKP